MSAFESGDLEGVVAVLTEDVWFTMPPLALEFQGRSKARQFLAAVTPPAEVARRLVATHANGQRASACTSGTATSRYCTWSAFWC